MSNFLAQNKKIKIYSLVLGIIFLSNCSTKNKKTSAQKVSSQNISSSSAEAKKNFEGGLFQLRPIEEINLENGLQIFVIRDKRLPRISLSMMIKVGQRNETAELNGLNNLTAALLETETRSHKTLQLADALAKLGTTISVDSGDDATFVVTNALTESSNEILDLFHEVVTAPAFSDNEIQRIKSEIRSSLKKRVDNPSTVASDQLHDFLYKDHIL